MKNNIYDYIKKNITMWVFIIVSIMLWYKSLSVSAITHQLGVFYGKDLLEKGIAYGWVTLFAYGQAYCNITYFICVIKLVFFDNPIKLSVCTFLYGISSFFLYDVGYSNKDFPDADTTKIYSWEWGAIYWITALALVMFICIYKRFNQKQIWLLIYLILIISAWAVIYQVGKNQYSKANIRERSLYFTKNTAFTIQPIIDFIYVPFDKVSKNINEDTLIEFKGNLYRTLSEIKVQEFDVLRPKEFQSENNMYETESLKIRLPKKFIHKNKLYFQFDRSILMSDLLANHKADITINGLKNPSSQNLGIQIFKKTELIWSAPFKDVGTPRYHFSALYNPIDNKKELSFQEGRFDRTTFKRLNFQKIKDRNNEVSYDLYQIDSQPKPIHFYDTAQWELQTDYVYQVGNDQIFMFVDKPDDYDDEFRIKMRIIDMNNVRIYQQLSFKTKQKDKLASIDWENFTMDLQLKAENKGKKYFNVIITSSNNEEIILKIKS